ncbi:MAG: hypothetical protein ACI9J3_001901 [Parvicellaceae bacterium]|jgi:hypothetical protein
METKKASRRLDFSFEGPTEVFGFTERREVTNRLLFQHIQNLSCYAVLARIIGNKKASDRLTLALEEASIENNISIFNLNANGRNKKKAPQQ